MSSISNKPGFVKKRCRGPLEVGRSKRPNGSVGRSFITEYLGDDGPADVALTLSGVALSAARHRFRGISIDTHVRTFVFLCFGKELPDWLNQGECM